MITGGESGIRTRGGLLTPTRFPGVRLKPLIHLSADRSRFYSPGIALAVLLQPVNQDAPTHTKCAVAAHSVELHTQVHRGLDPLGHGAVPLGAGFGKVLRLGRNAEVRAQLGRLFALGSLGDDA